jgi:hypothetical protein
MASVPCLRGTHRMAAAAAGTPRQLRRDSDMRWRELCDFGTSWERKTKPIMIMDRERERE